MNVFSLLPDFLQGALVRLNIIDPTPVQQAALPPALNGQDVLGTAQTGTGKTFAFLLPMTVRLVNHPAENALILSPTRELAQQTYQEFLKLADSEHPLSAALVIGGDNIHKQYADLRRAWKKSHPNEAFPRKQLRVSAELILRPVGGPLIKQLYVNDLPWNEAYRRMERGDFPLTEPTPPES